MKEFEAQFPNLNSAKREVKMLEEGKARKIESEAETRQSGRRNKSNEPIPDFIRKKIFSTVEVPHFIFDEGKAERRKSEDKKKQRNISMQLKRKDSLANGEREGNEKN